MKWLQDKFKEVFIGNCKYCNEKKELFFPYHKKCEEKYKNGESIIIKKIINAISNQSNYQNLDFEIKDIAVKSHIKKYEIMNLYVSAFDIHVNQIIENGIISFEQEENLLNFTNHFNFKQEILDKNSSIQKIVKSSILRDVLNGEVPRKNIKINGDVPFPFLLQKNEVLIWIFQQVECFEKRTRTMYQGSSIGGSFRVAKGFYVRSSSFRGNPIKIDETISLGNGLVAITDKYIYFGNSQKSFKISHKKLLLIVPYKDGIELQKDTITSKPILLKGLDGWFIYNLIFNLSKI